MELPAHLEPIDAWREIRADLRRDLAAGRYAEGQPLPTEAELALAYAVSRQTVRRAMQKSPSDRFQGGPADEVALIPPVSGG